jgi:hypothetical protein
VDRAGQRLGEGGELKADTGGQRVQVLGDEPGWDQDLLGEPAQQILEVLAKVGAPTPALDAGAARGRVGAEDVVAGREAGEVLADRGDDPRELVAEPRRVGAQGGVAAVVHLAVGAAGQRGPDGEHHLAGAGLGCRHLVDAQVGRPVEQRRLHGPPPPSTTTLMA